MRRSRIQIGPVVLLLALAGFGLTLAGCVDEEVVFRDRPLFQDPPSGAGSFLGYSDSEEKLTTCGNCHVGMQAGWETTGHAGAWEGLQAGGHAQEFCEGCHSVNELGNPSEDAAGWTATGDPRYHDVQCESCHGPGLDHVENPDATQPLANFAVQVTDPTTGCAECHSGTHHPFTDQWALSAHGQVPALPTAEAVGSFCLPCHEGKSALRSQFSENTDFVESEGPGQPITCATCHDPHGSEFTANLRAPIDERSDRNLCVTCHSRRGTPDFAGSNDHGPHAFQGPLVLGEDVGWIPDEFQFDASQPIASSHGSDANPRLCATCHVSSFTVTDAETGEFQFEAVGHTFNAIPCVDSEGVPTASTDCALTTSERQFESCAASGCHDSETQAQNALTSNRGILHGLLDALWTDGDGDAVLETADGGLLPQVLAQVGPSEIDPFDNAFTTAEGALWNAQIAFTDGRPHWGDGRVEGQEDSFGSHKGSGEGVHNPFLTRELVRSACEAVANEYGLTLPNICTPGTVSGSVVPPHVSLR